MSMTNRHGKSVRRVIRLRHLLKSQHYPGHFLNLLLLRSSVAYYALLYLKPQFALDASIRAKLYKDLWIKAQYRLEQRVEVEGLERAEDVNALSLSAGYEFFNRLNVFVGVNNLLNRTYLTETGYPVQGFNVMAGVSVRF